MKSSAHMNRAYRGEQDRDHAAKAGSGIVGAHGRELHALREADDLCHGGNVATAATSVPTMIDGAFQGEA